MHAHGAKAKEVLEGAGLVLSEVFGQLFPRHPVPPSVPELVQSFVAEEDMFGEYYKMQRKAGAKTAITFALASGIDGDFEKAYEDIPQRPGGKKVPLKPFDGRAGELAELLSELIRKINASKTSTSASASVAP